MLIVAGWGLVLVGLALRFESGNAVLAFLTLGATLTLWGKRDFPHRDRGLSVSFVGPLLSVAWAAAYPIIPATTEGWFLLAIVANGVMRAAQLTWLSRGFGAIPFLSVVSVVSRWVNPSQADAVRQQASRYPFRLWWLLPAIPVAASAVVLTTSIAFYYCLGH